MELNEQLKSFKNYSDRLAEAFQSFLRSNQESLELVSKLVEIMLIISPSVVDCKRGFCKTLRKYAYSNTLKILPPKNGNFQIKNSNIFHISAQNIDCRYSLEPPRRGGSNEYPQSMFLSRDKKNNVYPCKPQFYYIKVGFKGVKIT